MSAADDHHSSDVSLRSAAIDQIFDGEKKINIEAIPWEQLYEESAKTKTLLYLVQQLRLEGHKTLVFSQSTLVLDIIEKVLRAHDFRLTRLDGSIRNLKVRDAVVADFQKGLFDVMLLTTQVGGVGLTLTAASRVIIYDPSW